ncbi:hypothetical protein BH09BAC1_BH09BAC1_03630 [soil metagenome]
MLIKLFVIAVVLFIPMVFIYRKKRISVPDAFPKTWRQYLLDTIKFYRNLDAAEQKQYEDDILYFLSNHKITGVETDVTDEDKLLVASSAVIPIFGFPEWHYHNLDEVILYGQSFNHSHETAGSNNERNILGMVGWGYMNGKMVLSKPSLKQGFENESSKSNVGIHEFVHLLDKADGATDGIPEALMNRQYTIPWMQMIKQKMEAIQAGKTDINPYGGVSETEFLPVVSEYFFNRPRLLKEKHPELYDQLQLVFQQDPAADSDAEKDKKG